MFVQIYVVPASVLITQLLVFTLQLFETFLCDRWIGLLFAEPYFHTMATCGYEADQLPKKQLIPKPLSLTHTCTYGEKTASFKANNQGQWVGWKITLCVSCVVVSYNISLLSCPAPPWSSCPPSQDPAAIWSPNSPLTNPVVTQLVRVMKMHEEGFKQRTDLDSRIYSNSTTLLSV